MYYGERLNSISHLLGATFALIGLGALLTISIPTGDLWLIFSFSVFGITLILLYTMSTLYHSFHPPKLKKLFKLLDHISIYLLIAGTYTPYMLVTLRDGNGWLMAQVIWALAALGILSEITLSGRLVKIGQLTCYLSMGWAIVFDFSNLEAALPEAGVKLLIAGGIAYTAGVIFYVLDKMKRLNHAHGIWHLFVLGGSVCHFIGILGYVR
ncbi:MAG: hemolysin III family protein [Pseudomonadales bacterium]|nr:hemolysin III family protein [Pseudomonadales bacterium]